MFWFQSNAWGTHLITSCLDSESYPVLEVLDILEVLYILDVLDVLDELDILDGLKQLRRKLSLKIGN